MKIPIQFQPNIKTNLNQERKHKKKTNDNTNTNSSLLTGFSCQNINTTNTRKGQITSMNKTSSLLHTLIFVFGFTFDPKQPVQLNFQHSWEMRNEQRLGTTSSIGVFVASLNKVFLVSLINVFGFSYNCFWLLFFCNKCFWFLL